MNLYYARLKIKMEISFDNVQLTLKSIVCGIPNLVEILLPDKRLKTR